MTMMIYTAFYCTTYRVCAEEFYTLQVVLETNSVYLGLYTHIFQTGHSQSRVLSDPGNNLLCLSAAICH
jgi:hypothetical protein